MEKEYQVALPFRIAVAGITVFAIIALLRSYPTASAEQAAWLLATVVIVLVMFFVIFFMLSLKVIITSNSIKTKSALANNEMLFDDVAGYKMRRIPKTRRYRIILVSKSGRTMRVPYSNLRDGEEILQLVESRFVNLDEQ
ncbi:hypothetical protein [Mucilaginibacter boryungensis]|uniref:PH (Pleckstrin Homology) domain-containing protein n=1 Tax=Mucilaginibacter boryungensis TaxID=768480 RepID=A0ABR9XJ79_9SPHI|nr:hypothetical protein [Mucilaginibacter boryungensis]MBE9667412.1 hypothetical protein [Mucilaginibacter boryungensis]